MVKPKAGFFIPFTTEKYSGLKLTAFYTYGLTKYEFYKNDIFDKRLINYSGKTKSDYQDFGAMVAVVFGF